MAEGKKRLYKRETIERIFNELHERVMYVNYEGHIRKVKDVIVFGSFVNTDKPMIHDLDVVYVLYESDFANRKIEETISWQRLDERRPFSYISWWDVTFYPENEIYWYLKNRQGIISLHGSLDLGAAVYQKHMYLMKDGVYYEKPLICEGTGIRI